MLIFSLLLISFQHTFVYSCIDLDHKPEVDIRLEIKGYSNPSMESCICPTAHNCSVKCHVQFSVIYTSDDGDIKNQTTNLLDLDANGELHEQEKFSYSQTYWLWFTTKPEFLKITANTSQSLIAPNGEAILPESFPQFDEFVIPLNNMTPSMWRSKLTHENKYVGRLHGSLLSLSIQVKCAGFLLGPTCDLKCIKHKNNTESALCVSVATGDHLVCKQVDDGQVDGCEKFPWTLNNSTFEMSDQEEQQYVQESTDWKMIAIAIGILVLTSTLTFLLGLKMSSRLSKEKKNTDNVSISHVPLVSL